MGIQNMNKKGFSITNSFYAIIVAGIIITSIGIIISVMGDFYGSDVTYDLEQYGRNDNVSDTVSQYEDRLAPDNVNPGQDFEATTFTGSFGIINTLFSAFRVVFGSGGMLATIAINFGIPMFITQGIVAMILVGITFAIVAIIFRLGRQP